MYSRRYDLYKRFNMRAKRAEHKEKGTHRCMPFYYE